MREEHNSVLSTTTEADKIGRFGRNRYIGRSLDRIYRFSARFLISCKLCEKCAEALHIQIKYSCLITQLN